MNILLINHYAGSTKHGMEYRPYYLAREWTRQGHQVTIVASSFSHLRSKNPQVQSFWSEENVELVRYVWLKGLPYSGNGVRRILNMLGFLALLAFFSRHLSNEKPDLVIGSSTYPLDMLIASRIARKAGARLVFEVHDLWPLSPIELGGMSPKHPYIRLMQYAEDFAYRTSDAVVSLLPLAEPYMASRGLPPDRFVCIPNGIDLQEWDGEGMPLPSEHIAVIDELKRSGKFLVGYAGSHGVSNALDVLLDAAQRLQAQPIAFVLVGQGPLKPELRSRAAQMGLQNIHFLEAIPKGMIPSFLRRMDALYLGWRRCSLYRFGISPNKLLDYMAAGKPVVHSVEAGNDLVREAGSGFSTPAESPTAIAEEILKLRSMSQEERDRMGRRGRSFVEAHHRYGHLAMRFVEEVLKIPTSTRAGR